MNRGLNSYAYFLVVWGYTNKANTMIIPAMTQKIQPNVLLQPSQRKLKTTSSPLIIQPNRLPPTKRRIIRAINPIIVSISIYE